VAIMVGSGLLSSLRHRDFRLLMGAFVTSTVGSWAYNVALTVWIFQETHSAGWVGAATIGRFLPALLFSAYGGVLAERFERFRLMATLDVISAAVMALLVVETSIHAPVALAILTAAVTSVIGTIYEPAVAASTPQLVGERDLGSANALRNTIDNAVVIAGPGLGAVLLLLGPPPIAIAVNAASFVVSALLVMRIHARSKPVDVTEGGELGAFRQMLVGAKSITSSSTAAVLVAYSVVATFVFGVDTVLLVVLSRDVLGTGAEGYGYLLAGLGTGGVLAAGVVARLERLPRLGFVILAGMAIYCLPTLLFLFVTSPVVAFVIEAVRGAGTLVVDVLAISALQRSLQSEVLARVFGAFNGFILAAVLLGASVAPPVLSGFGLTSTLWLAGAVLPAACLVGWPALQRMDRQAAERMAALQPRVDLLAACDLFAAVTEGSLEQLAGAAEEAEVPAGQAVVTEGEPADAFFVVMSGSMIVTGQGEAARSTVLRTLQPGDYFGEIGLIEGIPRTATVTAAEPSRVLRVQGDDFISALTESAPSPALLEGASMRLRLTHPSHQLSRAGLSATDRNDE
jgi:CRP-like cAMP-binding protein/predicted MFS family arabinose efflux permease